MIYSIAFISVTDPGPYAEYLRLSPPVVRAFGGRFVTRGGAQDVVMGDLHPQRVVIGEWPSLEAFRAFYDSPEYQAARSKRLGAADEDIVLLQGA